MQWRGRRGSQNVEDRRGDGRQGRRHRRHGRRRRHRHPAARHVHGRRPDVDDRPRHPAQQPHASSSRRTSRSSRPSSSPTPRTSGAPSSARWTVPTTSRTSCSSTATSRSACGTASSDGRSLLLFERPEGLHRPRASSRSSAIASARPATSPRRTSSPTRWGTTSRTSSASSTRSTSSSSASARQDANELSVRLELQADFLAGVWAHYADETLGVLEQGDLEEALNAATAIGDDKLQKQGQGYVVPDSFTHGTSAQRCAGSSWATTPATSSAATRSTRSRL